MSTIFPVIVTLVNSEVPITLFVFESFCGVMSRSCKRKTIFQQKVFKNSTATAKVVGKMY